MAILELPSILTELKKRHFFKKTAVDDTFDQINRSSMTTLLLIMALTVTTKAWIGNPISCNGFTKFKEKFSQDYCWTQGIYTIAEAYHMSREFIPYPGIVPEDIPTCLLCKAEDQQPTSRVYHLWYQWIPFYFWLSTIAFYMPYLLYKKFGFDDLKPLLSMLTFDLSLKDKTRKEKNDKDIEKASAWIFSRLHLYINHGSVFSNVAHKHKLGLILTSVKLLYLGISVLLMYLTSLMFPLADYKKYGYIWFTQKKSENHTGIGDLLFPKMVACEIKRWGASGLEDENGMCVLAPNVLHQYMFLILWFCLAFTICSNILSVLYNCVHLMYVFGSYRKFIMIGYMKDKVKYRKVYNNIGSSGRIILDIVARHMSTNSAGVMEIIMENISDRLFPGYKGQVTDGRGDGEGSISTSFVLQQEVRGGRGEVDERHRNAATQRKVQSPAPSLSDSNNESTVRSQDTVTPNAVKGVPELLDWAQYYKEKYGKKDNKEQRTRAGENSNNRSRQNGRLETLLEETRDDSKESGDRVENMEVSDLLAARAWTNSRRCHPSYNSGEAETST